MKTKTAKLSFFKYPKYHNEQLVWTVVENLYSEMENIYNFRIVRFGMEVIVLGNPSLIIEKSKILAYTEHQILQANLVVEVTFDISC